MHPPGDNIKRALRSFKLSELFEVVLHILIIVVCNNQVKLLLHCFKNSWKSIVEGLKKFLFLGETQTPLSVPRYVHPSGGPSYATISGITIQDLFNIPHLRSNRLLSILLKRD